MKLAMKHPMKAPFTVRRPATLVGAVLMALASFCSRAHADRAVALPVPRVDGPAAASPGKQTVVLAGGCFWGIQAVFQRVKGVSEPRRGTQAARPAPPATTPSATGIPVTPSRSG